MLYEKPLDRILKPILAVAATGLCGGSVLAKQPNIVFIVADDMGYADCGVHGSTDLSTPHIDSIAKAGVRFTDGYATGTVCSPTRAALMTARYQYRDGVPVHVRPDSESGLAEGVPTIPDYLRKAGYRTALIGKWHLGTREPYHPLNRGFDEFFGLLGGGRFYFEARIDVKGVSAPDDPHAIWRGREQARFDGYLTTVLGEEATKFVASQAGSEAPFMLSLWFTAPHAPMQAPKEIEAKFSHITDPKRRTYAAMMSAMDDAVGQVLAALREAGFERDTLVCFFSDNGGPTTRNGVNGSDNTPYRGSKGEVWEGGVRVPMFAVWPGRIEAGSVFEKPVTQMDLAATALALAGATPDDRWPIDGVNLMPFLDGKDAGNPRHSIAWAYDEIRLPRVQRAIRVGEMKLVVRINRHGERPEVGLYDLGADPAEANDLSPARPETVSELTAKLLDWCREVGTPLPEL
jgi:arylsulfatase A-like enzyme